jgi:pantoate--beta-alanine ligase
MATKRTKKKPARAAASKRKSTTRTNKRAPAVHERRVLGVVTEAGAIQSRMMAARARGLTVGLVPTMGALHGGHAALLDEARRRADVVVASIFVNPKQFSPGEDLSRYPRPFEQDRALCDACGVDVIFAPPVDEVYAACCETMVKAGPLASMLEGAARPGHFDGVLTVVLSLFQMVQPHFAVFGEKDYQQLTIIRRMVRDFRLPVEIVPMPVIRDLDGLALSSRNQYLSADDRQRATVLYRALMAAQDEAQRGVTEAERFVRAARAVLDAEPAAAVDYVEVRHPKTLAQVPDLGTGARLLMAVQLGGVRLIDNGPLFAGVRFP